MSTDDSPERDFDVYNREDHSRATLEDAEGTSNVSKSEDMSNLSNSMDIPKSRRTPRREVWWFDLGAKKQSLESIKQRFEDCLDRFILSSSYSPLRHITSPVDSKLRHKLHQCPGYLREEIALATDVSKSAIISHSFPSQSEVCSICGQLVQYKYPETPIVDGEMQEAKSPNGSKSHPSTEFSLDFSMNVSHLYMEPLSVPQSDVRKMVTPSLMDKFSPSSPDLRNPYLDTPQDSTRPQFNGPTSQILLDMSDSGSLWIPPLPSSPTRRRIPIACTNCRLRKLKVSKPFSKVSYPCSHYPSVVHSIQLIFPLVSDVSKMELFVNIVPLNNYHGSL